MSTSFCKRKRIVKALPDTLRKRTKLHPYSQCDLHVVGALCRKFKNKEFVNIKGNVIGGNYFVEVSLVAPWKDLFSNIPFLF